jgi:fructose-1,6-bisphosphatase/inositol monophosphatase family enzyme
MFNSSKRAALPLPCDGSLGAEILMDRPLRDQSGVDHVLLAKLSEEVAVAAASTLGAARTVRIKADQTPVTDADERSQAILMDALARLMPGVAVVSEEMAIRD